MLAWNVLKKPAGKSSGGGTLSYFFPANQPSTTVMRFSVRVPVYIIKHINDAWRMQPCFARYRMQSKCVSMIAADAYAVQQPGTRLANLVQVQCTALNAVIEIGCRMCPIRWQTTGTIQQWLHNASTGAYLIRADSCSATHCLTGGQHTHKIIVFHHFLHAVSQGDGHCQRQAFRHRHHHNGHAKDEEGQRAVSNVLQWKAVVLNTPPASAWDGVNKKDVTYRCKPS